MGKYAKAIVAVVGAAATAVIGLVGADSTVGKIATVVAAAATAAGVYLVPNKAPASK